MTDMPTLPETSLSQERVNKVVNLYLANATPGFNTEDLDPEKVHQINGQFVVAGESRTDEPFIMLASTSKLLIMEYFAQTLEQTKEETRLREVPVGIEVIMEMVGREPSRLFESELYGSFASTLDITEEEKAILLGDRSVPEWRPLVKSVQRSLLDAHDLDFSFNLPVEELFYHILTLSSNAATFEAKEFIFNTTGADFMYPKLEELAPNFHILETSAGFRHWVQPDGNVGKLGEIVDVLDELVKRYVSGNVDTMERMLVESMMNNVDENDRLGFDFTNSPEGRELIANGWKIVEKTGYYHCVFWVEGLANGKLGKYPMHMTFSTIVSLIPPDGSAVRTFGKFSNFEVAKPSEPLVVEQLGITFPNDEGELYDVYETQASARLKPDFRGDLVKEVKANGLLN